MQERQWHRHRCGYTDIGPGQNCGPGRDPPGSMKSMNPRAESLEHLRWGSKTSKRKTAGRPTGGLPSGVVMEHAGAHEVRLGIES